jgi:hypothetical protein
MAIRKVLLPLISTGAGEAALSSPGQSRSSGTRTWLAPAPAMSAMFQRFTVEHRVKVAEATAGAESATASLHEVPLGGADGVAIDAACLDLRTPPVFDRVVDADHQRPAGQQPVQQVPQETLCQGARIPARASQRAGFSTSW